MHTMKSEELQWEKEIYDQRGDMADSLKVKMYDLCCELERCNSPSNALCSRETEMLDFLNISRMKISLAESYQISFGLLDSADFEQGWSESFFARGPKRSWFRSKKYYARGAV